MTAPSYAKQAPHPQQTLNIFEGQWASAMPRQLGNVTAGAAGLFEDPRVSWATDQLRKLGTPIEQSSVLELGPLEGGHTFLLAKAGAASVTAVEAHSGAFLKCLVAKELLGIERVNFLYGDAVEFLKQTDRQFDIGFACGFLYHMANPVEVIALLAKRCTSLFLWTVHWDEGFSKTGGEAVGGRGAMMRSQHEGFLHTLHRHDYGRVAELGTFWGGPASYAYWMERDEIVAALKHFGFHRVYAEADSTVYGAVIKLVATKRA